MALSNYKRSGAFAKKKTSSASGGITNLTECNESRGNECRGNKSPYNDSPGNESLTTRKFPFNCRTSVVVPLCYLYLFCSL